MTIVGINSQGVTGPRVSASEQVTAERKDKASDSAQAAQNDKKVQPEELLKQIKALTEDGLYSVRFETNDAQDIVVQIYNNDSQELVRQIPPEEVQEFKKAFQDLLGNFVDTKG